jgi:hypothetical protein
MKRISQLLSVGILAAGFFMSSCSKDDTKPEPTIEAILNNVVQDSVTVTSGSSVSYEFDLRASAKLKSITIMKTVGANTTTFLSKTDNFVSDTLDIISGNLTVSANTQLNITVIDKNEISVSKVVTIKIAAVGEISTYTSKLLGAQSSTSGSALSTSGGTIFSKSEAATNSASVDFIYYYGGTSVLAEIISPLYGSVNYTSYVTSSWGTKNSTKFAKTTAITSAEFDAATNDSKITSVVSSITWNTDERVVTLAIGDIFAFETAAGMYGLAKVTNLVTGESGSITLAVMVQK